MAQAQSKAVSSNGEPVVVRAAMKPLPTLMRPLRSVGSRDGSPGRGSGRAERRAGGRGGRVVAEAAVAWKLARAAREKFGGDTLGDFLAAHDAYLERIR